MTTILNIILAMNDVMKTVICYGQIDIPYNDLVICKNNED